VKRATRPSVSLTRNTDRLPELAERVPRRGLTRGARTRCDRECRNARTSAPGVLASWHSVLKV
jgi:hypothetical protein